MERIRRPFQGISNIVRFNWHFYVIGILMLLALLVSIHFLNDVLQLLILTVSFLTLFGLIFSLITSYYIYDVSELYSLDWLDKLGCQIEGDLLNITAGFDETSALIKAKYEKSELLVLDFYDPLKHTEVSIKRARQAYPIYPGTINITSNDLSLKVGKYNTVFIFMTAHEIRDSLERTIFFREISKGLAKNGKVIVVEHLRDGVNFFAFNIGFFHFYSKSTWLNTFEFAGLKINQEIKITPFISTFLLEKL